MSVRGKKFELITYSAQETFSVGEKTGRLIKDGIVFALTGELGSGKTCFVGGLAAGLKVPDNYYITSPTYTFINEYPGRYPLFHVDLYRIGGQVEIEDIGFWEILYGYGVIAIEWAERLREGVLPRKHVAIHFKISGDESRKLYMTASELESINLLEQLEKQVF